MKASKRLCIIQKSSVWIILTISKNTFWDEIPCRLHKDIKDNFSVQDDFNPNNELKKEVPVSKYDLNGHYKIVEKSNRAYCRALHLRRAHSSPGSASGGGTPACAHSDSSAGPNEASSAERAAGCPPSPCPPSSGNSPPCPPSSVNPTQCPSCPPSPW